MLSPVKICTEKIKGLFDKKGVSVIIGYVLLVTIAIVMGVLVYSWIKTYVPKEASECPDGVSLFIKSYNYDCETKTLTIELKNNGRFNLLGYFIYATTSPEQELATIDLTNYFKQSEPPGAMKFNVGIKFYAGESTLPPNQKVTHKFDLSDVGQIYSIEIIPMRYQVENNKERVVSCSNAKIEEAMSCYQEVCISEDISMTCAGRVCGERVNNCGNLVTCPPGCTGSDVCNSLGQCIPQAQCTDTCVTYGYQCGTWTICGFPTTCGNFGGGCDVGYECNVGGQCVVLCGNSILNPSEACDDGNTVEGDGCSSTCTIESGFTCDNDPMPSVCQSCGNGIIEGTEGCDDGNTNPFDGCSSSCTVEIGFTCSGQPSSCTYAGGAPSCLNYCVSLQLRYTSSLCPFNTGQCIGQANNGDVKGTAPGQPGYDECTATGATGDYVCCCKPAV